LSPIYAQQARFDAIADMRHNRTGRQKMPAAEVNGASANSR
jgi:hypothetical protein